MNYIMFQPQFAELVASGRKRQTIRPRRRRLLKVGERISLRKWEGSAYRSPQVELRQGKITSVQLITISADRMTFCGPPIWDHRQLQDFAQADGFHSWQELVSWFDRVHGLPFRGIVIRWRPLVPERGK